MELKLLADCPEAVSTIAHWYFDEWGYISEVSTIEKSAENVRKYLNRDKVPLMVVAFEGDEAIGTAQLKFHEMPQYTDYEHWLGGVYVAKDHRGKKVAEKIIEKLVEHAKALGVKTLYLQTENLNGGLYERMGWQGIEQVNNRGIEVLVMEKPLKD